MKKLLVVGVALLLMTSPRAQVRESSSAGSEISSVPAGTISGVAAMPTLTEVQALQLKNVVLRIQLAQARAQMAQAEFDQARAAAGTLVQSLQVNGYTLDLDQMVYVPKAAGKAPPN